MPDVAFWENRYESGDTPWDLGDASPHFVKLLQAPPEFLKPGKMAVVGCGRGHDAALFARAGYEVTGYDYAPEAIAQAQARYGDIARFIQADITQIPEQFDYVLEHTCFCTFPPPQRKAYVEAVKNLLNPNGILTGVFWEHAEPDGPPYGIPLTEIKALFEPDFEFLQLTSAKPARDRGGTEHLILMRRRPPL